jgi:hypothetical protein
MSDDGPHPDAIDPQDAALARLADGSLPEAKREELRARVTPSPELRERLREQERAIGLVRSTGEIRAPEALRASVEELVGGSRRSSRPRTRAERRQLAPWRPRASIALVALAIVLIAVVSVALHGRSAPTIARTARLALAPATGPAPAIDHADHDLLSLRPSGAGRIPFPSYVRSAGWRPSGVRRDTLDGRRVTTVFYVSAGARVGYSIVSGSPLATPRGSTVRGPTGVRYVLSSSDGTALITWRRDGHTCVIAGRGATRRRLLALAAADEQV